jgi:2-polyprenyl-3-methyl-5-hydroxy-6-metoxy-1,4-benzoquinol methylase
MRPSGKQVPLNRLRKLLFDEYEAHYLRLNALTSDSLNEVSYQERMPDYEASYGRIVSGLPQGSRILDAGCGIGFLLFWLQQSRPEHFELVGVDISKPQITLAKKHLPETVTLLHEKAADFLGRNPRSFSAVFCTDVLEHIETDDEMLEFLECVRNSLLPSGLFICQVPNMANVIGAYARYIDLTHVRGFTDISLLQLLECAGFRECQIVRRKAADATQWFRLLVENSLHRVVYRICGVGNEEHFSRNLIGVGKA